MAFDSLLVEAKLALNQIGFSELPSLAVEALEEGLDGPAMRRIAALIQPTGFETDELLPGFMVDANLTHITCATACTRLAVALATEILNQRLDPIPYLDKLERWFMQAGYPAEFQEIGLIAEDAYVMEYEGSSEHDMRRWVDTRLRAFIAANAKNP